MITTGALIGGAALASWGGALAVAADAAAIAGTALSARSDYQSGKAEKQQAKAEAEQLMANARNAEANAAIAQQQSEQEQARRSRQLAADIGSQYANWAGNGLSVSGSSGDTFGDILKATTAEGVSDIDTIKDNGAIQMWKYQSEANAYRASAANALTRAKNAMSAAKTKMWGSIATGLASEAAGGVASYGAASSSLANGGSFFSNFSVGSSGGLGKTALLNNSFDYTMKTGVGATGIA